MNRVNISLIFVVLTVMPRLLLADENVSAVLFGKAQSHAREATHYKDFAIQGRFFSTADYGFIPGEPDRLVGKNFGLGRWPHALYTRGQDVSSGVSFCAKYYGRRFPWLSDGGSCNFGLEFDKPFTPQFRDYIIGPGQFDRFPNKIPRFSKIIVYWGEHVPRKGTWALSIEDTEGEIKPVRCDNRSPLYPYSSTTVSFEPTTVKKVVGKIMNPEGEANDNFAEVRQIELLLDADKTVDNRVLIWQMDAYQAAYSVDRPGTLLGIQPANMCFRNSSWDKFAPSSAMLRELSPFLESNGTRIYAHSGNYPVSVTSEGRMHTLGYALAYTLPNNAEAIIEVKAEFGINLEDTISFQFNAPDLPEGVRLGFEISSSRRLFEAYLASGKDLQPLDAGHNQFRTTCGPLGLRLESASEASLRTINESQDVRFDMYAKRNTLRVALSLPIGPFGGIQPGMVKYSGRPSLAGGGDEGLAPFDSEDLDLLEEIDLSGADGSYPVYDITNDPLVLNWRKSGDRKLPKEFGLLRPIIDNPDAGRVPLGTVLGEHCRVLGNQEGAYFRVNLRTSFLPQVPYLIVVEHAFDKERRGEFHCVPVDADGQTIVQDGSLWPNPAPFGGFDTGKGPYSGKFQKESVFVFRPWFQACAENTMMSLCFSNVFSFNRPEYFKAWDVEKPDGLAIKKMWIYKIKRMPQLPDIRDLLPKTPQRHIVCATENITPWALFQFRKFYGYNTLTANNQMPAELLHGATVHVSRPSSSAFHCGSLQGQKWLFQELETQGLYGKLFLQSILDIGLEETDLKGCFKNYATYNGENHSCVPLSPTEDELGVIATAIRNTLTELAPYKSLYAISIIASPKYFFTLRNLRDFSNETGVAFKASPVIYENIDALLTSSPETVKAWTQWSCRKRFTFLNWLLSEMRRYRPDIYLRLNHGWHQNWMMAVYYGPEKRTSNFDRDKLEKVGINDFYDFMKFVCHDPELYAGNDGFGFDMQGEEDRLNNSWNYKWASPYKESWFPKIRDSFTGGLSIHLQQFDESAKPLIPWMCTFVKARRTFRRELVEGLLYANAREFFAATFYQDPFRGRLDDLRGFAIPFRLLPFVSPEKYEGKIADTVNQAVILKYEDRYGLMNAGDLPTETTLTLPGTATVAYDLSNGIREPLIVQQNPAGERQITITMEQWTLRTLEIK